MAHPSFRLRRHAAILFVVITATAASVWGASQNLPNFQKVNDHIYRGAQPSGSGFQDLAQLGIKTVIDLREVGEHSQADEQKAVTGLGMRYVSIPMHGLSTPNEEKVAAVEALLNDTDSGPVFVHCKRGADRTGMVIAIYRISHDGWDNRKALSEAKSNGMSMFERAIQHYVMDFKPSVAVASAAGGAAPASLSAAASAVDTPGQTR